MSTGGTTGGELRLAVVGYGLAGATFHAPLIDAVEGLRLVFIVTSSAERRRAAQHDHPAATVLPSTDELWRRAGDIDLVTIASPNATHLPLALAALDAGLHVVVDKPVATTAAAARALAVASRARGRHVVPFHNRRWDGDFLTVRKLLADGSLGQVARFESRFDRWRALPKPRWCEPDARANGEGIILDIGSHLVDQALQLFGRVADVYAEADRRHPEVTVEEDAFLALRHASGVRSHLYMSNVAAQPGPRVSLFGSSGAYIKHGIDVQEDALRQGARPVGATWGIEPESRWGTLVSDGATRIVPTQPGAYPRFYEGVRSMLRDGAPPPVAIEDAITGLEILEHALATAREEG